MWVSKPKTNTLMTWVNGFKNGKSFQELCGQARIITSQRTNLQSRWISLAIVSIIQNPLGSSKKSPPPSRHSGPRGGPKHTSNRGHRGHRKSWATKQSDLSSLQQVSWVMTWIVQPPLRSYWTLNTISCYCGGLPHTSERWTDCFNDDHGTNNHLTTYI